MVTDSGGSNFRQITASFESHVRVKGWAVHLFLFLLTGASLQRATESHNVFTAEENFLLFDERQGFLCGPKSHYSKALNLCNGGT